MPGIWKHETKDNLFLLVLDDFVIKYTYLDNSQHLLNALKTEYTISEDWKAQMYMHTTLKCYYRKKQSMCQCLVMLTPTSSSSTTSNTTNKTPSTPLHNLHLVPKSNMQPLPMVVPSFRTNVSNISKRLLAFSYTMA